MIDDPSGRKKIAGYTAFGGIRVPGIPQYIVMVDREDGTEWYLSHDESRTHFAINSGTIVQSTDVRRYGPYAGPYLSTNPRIKLLIRNGRLGYEVETLPPWLTGRNNAKVSSRRGYTRFTAEIVVPDGWSNGHGLAWDMEAL